MKKDKNELIRLQTLIENDRINMGDSFLQLVVSDADLLLRDYFDFRSPPEISITKSGSAYKIELSILATRVKKFTTIPK